MAAAKAHGIETTKEQRPKTMHTPTPTRPVPFWRLFLRGWGWIAVPLVPIVLIVAVVSLNAGHTAVRLALDGVTTEARIMAKHWEKADPNSRGNSRYVYHLEFRFSVDGAQTTDTARVSKAFSNSHRRDQIVPVRYAASNPLINEIEPGAHARELRNGLIGLLLVFAVAGPILRRRWHRARDMAFVRDNGEARKAVVTSHEATGILVNSEKTLHLHWRDETGITGRSSMLRHHARTLFPVGAEITIYIDRTGTRPPVWQAEVGVPRARA